MVNTIHNKVYRLTTNEIENLLELISDYSIPDTASQIRFIEMLDHSGIDIKRGSAKLKGLVRPTEQPEEYKIEIAVSFRYTWKKADSTEQRSTHKKAQHKEQLIYFPADNFEPVTSESLGKAITNHLLIHEQVPLQNTALFGDEYLKNCADLCSAANTIKLYTLNYLIQHQKYYD